MFWLKHPEHGEMPAYDVAEVERNKKWGWELLNEGPSPLRDKPGEVVPERRKPGRPPKAK